MYTTTSISAPYRAPAHLPGAAIPICVCAVSREKPQTGGAPGYFDALVLSPCYLVFSIYADINASLRCSNIPFTYYNSPVRAARFERSPLYEQFLSHLVCYSCVIHFCPVCPRRVPTGLRVRHCPHVLHHLLNSIFSLFTPRGQHTALVSASPTTTVPALLSHLHDRRSPHWWHPATGVQHSGYFRRRPSPVSERSGTESTSLTIASCGSGFSDMEV